MITNEVFRPHADKLWLDVINDSESYQSTPPLTMQTQTLDGSFNQTLPLSEHPHGHFGQANGLNNSDSSKQSLTSSSTSSSHVTARSQSRSTDSSSEGSQQSAAAPAEQQPPSVSSTSTTQIPNLNAALQQSLESTTFPNFNNQDLFNFQNQSLLQYPMLSQFGRNPQMTNAFETKPDVGQLQQQMQMREAKPYKCNQCIKSFANSSYLSQHMRIHLGIKPFGPCQYCGKKFTQLSHLQQHIRTHTGEKPYKCKFTGCEKAFSQLSNLQSHSRCHQTDKPYKCNSCYKCFADEQSLLDHIPKHKESKHLKVHICPFCGKSYTQATYLQKHMTKHSDRTRTSGISFRNDFGAEHIELWNQAVPGMAESHEQFALSQSVMNQAMMNQAVSAAGQANPYNSGIPNSAFTQLLNFRNPRQYFDYQNNIKATERPTGFNMITPLENIQRYTQQGGSAAHQQFPNSIITHMKQTY